MSPHTLEHALKTLAGLLLLWALPWAVILTIAALAGTLQTRLGKKEPTPVHFPHSKTPRAA